ncbi:MAG TPA: sigma-70 family RNA polymerase sigma factor [Candidatus Saccharimonadia bacterium]|nr:sigma-70 family RNA polymerase sigma factor [Candidatus Saccharimonadia bacterium]
MEASGGPTLPSDGFVPTDEQLMARIAALDASAIEALYDRYGSMAFGLATRITGDAALAEDVVQDAFLGVWRSADRYIDSRATAKTWLLSIVHHRAIDAVRRRRPTVELPDPEVTPPRALVVDDAWQEVLGRLDRAAIGMALATLSVVQREAIELAYFGGLTQAEIAERTGTPLGTVKSRVRLGLLSLRDAMISVAGEP